jgi:hypothetical protein
MRNSAIVCISTALLLTLLPTPSISAEQTQFEMPQDINAQKVDVYSEGTRMTGYLYSSRAASKGTKLPTIVMAHGWGGTQALLRRDAIGFARAGYLVMTFDYRGWGESDSRVILTAAAPDSQAKTFNAEVRAIREVVDPLDMGTDWLNALHYIQGEPVSDVSRIGIWGSSMAGGYVVYAAAHDPRVKAVHSQVTGTLNGRAWGRSPEAQQEATRRSRGEIGYPEPRTKFGNLTGAPITPRFADYTPNEDIRSNNSVALQFVLAESEEYGGNNIAIETYEQHQGPKNLVVIKDIGHYDVYQKAWQEAHTLAIEWFDTYLK